jgi:hypothetical protein
MVYNISEVASPPEDQAEDDLLDRITVLQLSFPEQVDAGAKIHCTSLRTFLVAGRKGWEGGLKRARYDVSTAEHILKLPGTCYPFEADSNDVALSRGKALLQISETSSARLYELKALTQANCEHVIVWCKTGQWRSSQVNTPVGLARVATLAAAGVAACRGLSGGNGSQGPGILAPLLGGALLWKVSQQESANNRADKPPGFVIAAGAELQNHEGIPSRHSSLVDSNAEPGIEGVNASGPGAHDFARHTTEEVIDDFVLIEDMHASREFVKVEAPPKLPTVEA